MFDKFVEQTQSAVKPFSELLALNVKAVERLVDKQSSLFTGVMNDGVNYAKEVAAAKRYRRCLSSTEELYGRGTGKGS